MVLSKRLKTCLSALLPPAFWLGVWQLCAFLVERWVEGRGNELLLPYPATVARSLAVLALSPAFWQTVAATLGRIVAGMAVGTLAGVLLAVFTWRFVWADRLFSPVIRVIRATPVASFILLLLLWISRNLVPGVISGLMVLPVVWENLTRGLGETDRQLLELARAYRFSTWKRVRLVYLPSLRPYFLSAVTTSMGLAWKSGVAAEVIGIPEGSIGEQLYYSKLYLDTAGLFAWTFVIIIVSALFEHLFLYLLKKVRH